MRPTPRNLPKAILGENTPQSATMLALHNTPTPRDIDTSLSNITNGSSSMIRTPYTFDAISTQILSLTTIATNLQREMAQLSRRSKDNATDLISLKEATNARDEDIRKSLRELVSNLSIQSTIDNGVHTRNQYMRGPASYLLDNKPHTPSALPKSVSLPRIPSPTSFAATIEREIANSPLPFSIDGAASIALLEKILREMGTKDGQERVLSSLIELKNSPETNSASQIITKKLEEILEALKDNSGSRALITQSTKGKALNDRPPTLELDFDAPKNLPVIQTMKDLTGYSKGSHVQGTDHHQKSYPAHKAADFVSDDMHKLLKKMKDSITESGGLSAEIKALVRELRGEVLGMGREIGRKLEQAEAARMHSDTMDETGSREREEIAQIVADGLARLKEHMDSIMRDQRRQSASPMVSRNTVDSQEVYHAVKSALKEMPLQQQVAVQQPGSVMEREEILEAVREAWETYKPEIELQNFGLERDEILQCLKEGLQEYQPQSQSKEVTGATYDEVLDAVQEGLKHFKPLAPVATEASITREEILATVRDCLEAFEFPGRIPERERDLEITREDVRNAVKEGLAEQAPISRAVEVNRDDLFDAIKTGLETVPMPSDGVGEQVLERVQDLVDGIGTEFKEYSAANGRDTEQVLDAIRDGLEGLRAGIETYVDRAADVTGKDEIIETVRGGLENLRIDLEGTVASIPRSSEQTNSADLLDAMEKEFEHLRQTIAVSMVREGGSPSDKDEILDALRDGFEDMKVDLPRGTSSEAHVESIASMKEEFGHLRETLATTLTRSSPEFEKDEILDAIRDGFEEVKADLRQGASPENHLETLTAIKFEFEQLRETMATTLTRNEPSADKHEILATIREGFEDRDGKPESVHSNTSELVEAFNDGLDALKVDIEKLINKPIDMTVNYEILDTLKAGLSGVRAEIDLLRVAQEEQESLSNKRGGEVVVAEPNVKGLERDDIQNLEVMISQLRMKVESLDSVAPDPPLVSRSVDENVVKDDIQRLEGMMRELQVAVTSIGEQQESRHATTVTKDDTDAIETLLRNTKAVLDELSFPEPENMARTEHLELVEVIIKSTRDAVEDLATRQEVDVASKEDIGALGSIIKDLQGGLDELREKAIQGEAIERLNKSDIEVLESLCLDTKTQIEELVLPNVANLPTKGDVDSISGLIKEFQEKVEVDAELTAQAFEARKIEHGGIADKVEDVKLFLEDVRTELKSQIEGSGQGIEGLAKTLENIKESIAANEANSSVKELLEIISHEFERSNGNHEGAKLDMEANRDVIMDKHEEHKVAIIGDIAAKIDARFDELVAKYDDAQLTADAKASALDGKDEKQQEALDTTRSIADDLRILVTTLGSTVTESCERMGNDSMAVYDRLETLSAKVDQSANTVTTEMKGEHQLTRAELSKALVAVEGVQAHVQEYHPSIISAITDVRSILGQHFEQAQRSTEEIKTSVKSIPAAIPLPAITAAPEPLAIEKYDDTEVHAKLDRLVQHTTETSESVTHFNMLQHIKEQVATSAAEFREFVTVQQAFITDAQTCRSREADETKVALDQRLVQKTTVEADIVRLSDEKHNLGSSVESLRKEERELASQKSRLLADLSGLETALRIRREEMFLIESKAEAIERRIRDDILDHARTLLRRSKPHPPNLSQMNLKRVASTASDRTTSTLTSLAKTSVPSAASSAIGMALKRRLPPRSMAVGLTGSIRDERRILSLSTIGGNRGYVNDRALISANSAFSGASAAKIGSALASGGLKRSQSVKSNFPLRKTSWGGTKQIGLYGDDVPEDDKENSILDEEDEDAGSEGTERRTSHSGTYSGTGSYGTGSLIDGDDERGNSYPASTAGTIGRSDGHLEEESSTDGESSADEGSNEGEDHEEEEGEAGIGPDGGDFVDLPDDVGNVGEVVVYSPPSDSGIGTDIPTAGLEVDHHDYFKR